MSIYHCGLNRYTLLYLPLLSTPLFSLPRLMSSNLIFTASNSTESFYQRYLLNEKLVFSFMGPIHEIWFSVQVHFYHSLMVNFFDYAKNHKHSIKLLLNTQPSKLPQISHPTKSFLHLGQILMGHSSTMWMITDGTSNIADMSKIY